MVKGNWERRAELASLRREEEKSLKAAKRELRATGSKIISAEGAITRLRNRATQSIVHCWLDSSRAPETQEDSKRPRGNSLSTLERCDLVCKSWFRTNFCEKKRCKLPHNPSPIAHLRGVVFDVDGDEEEEERSCCPEPVTLESITSKDFQRLRFIAIASRCIYDYSRPSVWDCFMQESIDDVLHANFKCLAIKEGSNEDEIGEIIEPNGGCHKKSDVEDKHDRQKFSSVFFGKRGAALLFPVVLSYLSVAEIFGNFILVSREVKKRILGDEQTRERRRTTYGGFSAVLSKEKKQERKKKKKNSFLPAKDKVDAFARGIPR